MHKTWLKYIMIFFLLATYVNRGLFVSDKGTESMAIASSKHEVNSLLEAIMNLAGLHNETDEDGDSPESYGVSIIMQPHICQDLGQVLFTDDFLFGKDDFIILDEIVLPTPIYKQIDRPPKDFC